MNDRIADPRALGFGVLGIAFWMHAMAYAGWFPMAATGSGSGMSAAVLATFALLVAAIASFLKGQTWHATFFMFWSALFWGLKSGGGGEAASAYTGWYFAAITLFGLLIWIRAMGDQEVGTPAVLTSLGIVVGFLAFALAGWGVAGFFWVIGGYVGLITALLAFWAAADAMGTGGVGSETETATGVEA